MNLKIEITQDGSHTLFVPEMGERYHSTFGAVNESKHVYIENGLKAQGKKEVNILEVGFGTGLNAFLSMLETMKTSRRIHFTSVELFPLPIELAENLNFAEKIVSGEESNTISRIEDFIPDKENFISGKGQLMYKKGHLASDIGHLVSNKESLISDIGHLASGKGQLMRKKGHLTSNIGHLVSDKKSLISDAKELFLLLHRAGWNRAEALSDRFTLEKIVGDFSTLLLPMEKEAGYDVIFYDAFAPEKQPEMWTQPVFDCLFALSASGAVLTTYCAKGVVRRMMQAAGFVVERLPGPAGKREMLRARRL